MKNISAPSHSTEGSPKNAADLSSSDVIFRGVLRRLFDGRFVPGQRLVEADLARDFNMGRSSVREALSRLAAEGVISLTRHRGAYIRRVSRAEVRDILGLMELMIGFAARLAAQNIKQAGAKAALRKALKALIAKAKSRDYMEYVRARNSYYRILIQIGGNRELSRLLPSMHVNLIRFQLHFYLKTAEQSRFKEYERLTEAVLAGEVAQSERLARNHINLTLQSLESLTDEAFGAPESSAHS